MYHHDSCQLVGFVSWGLSWGLINASSGLTASDTVIYHSWYCSSSLSSWYCSSHYRGRFSMVSYTHAARDRYHMSVGVCDCCYSFTVTGIYVVDVCAGSMLLVLLMTMATASLSASFSVFLVRERANKSKHVQVHLLSLSPLNTDF